MRIIQIIVQAAVVVLPLLVTGCHDEQGPKPRIPHGGKPVSVPELTGWDVLAIVVLALVAAALVEKWMRRDQ